MFACLCFGGFDDDVDDRDEKKNGMIIIGVCDGLSMFDTIYTQRIKWTIRKARTQENRKRKL